MTLRPEPSPAPEARPDLGPPRGEVAFRLLIEAVEDYAIFLLSPEGTILTWNAGAERIKGYAAEEIIGRHFSVFYTEEDRQADLPMHLLGKAGQQGRFEIEGWRVRKDGTRFWADVILTALRDENGEPYAFAKITRDLTERRAAEQQQRELLAEQRARAAAEQALAARDRFLSIASHELKTPVASLRLSAEGLLHARGAGRLDDERLTTGLERITAASQRLGALVDELLDITRLEAEELPLTRASTDLVSLAREVIERFEQAGDTGRITLEAPPRLNLEVDVGRIDQVLTNLVDNALKYSPDGTPVHVTLAEHLEGVLIEVRDRGIGLDDSAGQRLFEAFGRGENAEHFAGLGLGLHIAREIVSHHGGRIEPMSRDDGAGSVFRVILPRTGRTDR